MATSVICTLSKRPSSYNISVSWPDHNEYQIGIDVTQTNAMLYTPELVPLAMESTRYSPAEMSSVIARNSTCTFTSRGEPLELACNPRPDGRTSVSVATGRSRGHSLLVLSGEPSAGVAGADRYGDVIGHTRCLQTRKNWTRRGGSCTAKHFFHGSNFLHPFPRRGELIIKDAGWLRPRRKPLSMRFRASVLSRTHGTAPLICTRPHKQVGGQRCGQCWLASILVLRRPKRQMQRCSFARDEIATMSQKAC